MNDVWNEIADIMQISIEKCRSKMLSLLSSCRREKAKIKLSEGTGQGK